ncbi:ARM repeat superfamily protein [Klebsormidium nitens]|uniref:ARM repeat superfamily protein n=1 Tax=Klebsormidium nitens TaxID=105231 RepID=A0A1Y1HP80_KLENI|nr:ARM repeat superfamily protein [Klebsormidium nitens]|eukprot:GAQ78416.1 ARM repeat superfamily protein [Klebsormidium nitens]
MHRLIVKKKEQERKRAVKAARLRKVPDEATGLVRAAPPTSISPISELKPRRLTRDLTAKALTKWLIEGIHVTSSSRTPPRAVLRPLPVCTNGTVVFANGRPVAVSRAGAAPCCQTVPPSSAPGEALVKPEVVDVLVEYNNKKVFDIKLRELKATVTTTISEEAPVDDVIAFAKKEKKDSSLPEVDVLLDLWDAMMDAVQWSGKNQQQNTNLALRQVKGWGKLLGAFSTTSKAEFALIYKVQACCYEDAKLMKLFAEIVRILYDLDVLGEDTILTWYRKGTNPKGRQVFVKALEPFVKWLEEAEEEDDE